MSERTGLSLSREVKNALDAHRKTIPYTDGWDEYLLVLLREAADATIEDTNVTLEDAVQNVDGVTVEDVQHEEDEENDEDE